MTVAYVTGGFPGAVTVTAIEPPPTPSGAQDGSSTTTVDPAGTAWRARPFTCLAAPDATSDCGSVASEAKAWAT
jgi:hypothetical protein